MFYFVLEFFKKMDLYILFEYFLILAKILLKITFVILSTVYKYVKILCYNIKPVWSLLRNCINVNKCNKTTKNLKKKNSNRFNKCTINELEYWYESHKNYPYPNRSEKFIRKKNIFIARTNRFLVDKNIKTKISIYIKIIKINILINLNNKTSFIILFFITKSTITFWHENQIKLTELLNFNIFYIYIYI